MDKNFVMVIMFPVIALLMIFATEYTINTIYYNKITTVSEFAIKTAENEGGITESVIEKVEYRMQQEGLSSDHFDLEYILSPQINYNEPIEINVKGEFTYRALNLLGTGMGNIDVEFEAPNVGYSNVWHR